MATLSAFLVQAREALANRPVPAEGSGNNGGSSRPLTFVVGNESADLDSLCSALVLAYFKSQAPSSTPGQGGRLSNLHIPLCNIPRADLALRPEFSAVLREANVTPDEVITLDDLPSPFPSPDDDNVAATRRQEPNGEIPPPRRREIDPGMTRWILVDHNVLTGRLARDFLSGSGRRDDDRTGKVVGCIDHHEDEGRLPADCEPRVVEKSGSCMSLVVEHCKPVWEALSSLSSSSGEQEHAAKGDTGDARDETTRQQLDDQLARLVLAPIVIDTNNLRDGNKTTDHDTGVVRYLEETKLHHHRRKGDPDAGGGGGGGGGGGDDEGFDRAAYFERISRLKNDISQMSLRDILRKDYKEWTEAASPASATGTNTTTAQQLRLGTMSVPQPLAYLLEHTCHNDTALFLGGLREWADEKELDVASIMTAYEDPESGGFKRDLLVWAPPRPSSGQSTVAAAGIAAVRKFVEDHEDTLKLIPWQDGRLDSTPGDSGVGGGGGGGDGAEDGFRRCWTQGTLKNSRKQIAPMLREAMRSVLG
ncbi:uncharacterized protein B0I36DRAFT_374176 [Microdochium trichocladiopsis]|uniref:DHHA2 domain-containing protein n=1 Tax=Microdochium trichocladiopsis TaxID=1682393 RepID=A0A9P8Y9H7_9PEZI|nr:uncharacterized protein B0I36DRAFT_374176 [Microdochium trichocladiopsis]KAH7031155.1 hypothetical protein B0I36DRAFT_374176 [Microdochium trichocladiopsis]